MARQSRGRAGRNGAAAIVCALVLVGGAAPGAAQDVVPPIGGLGTDSGPLDGTFAVVVENDAFAGTDRNYSNGLKLSYLAPQGGVPDWLEGIFRPVITDEDFDDFIVGFELGQSIFTPQDISVAAPLPDQHPYAGWLYGGVSGIATNGQELQILSIQAGIVGPSSLAEETQEWFHQIIDGEEPEGWANQLKDEPGFVVSFERRWRRLVQAEALGINFDASPGIGVSLGNVLTQAKAGVIARFGKNLRYDLGPPRIRPSLAGAGFFQPQDGFSWYVFGGVEGRAVARNIFLDGNTFRESLEVEKNTFVADFQFGVALQFNEVQVAWSFVRRTREFESQEDPQRFGAFSVAVKF
jgi:hypothetical protein